ncbi:DUF2267 domain-containing protein [Methylocystis sp. 9N]|uniref:DUF2267 domain-containing protein n=1 Tax=Methylocystis borbori TaxID=3118750 RepID=A0ABU7XJT4_9HYPH
MDELIARVSAALGVDAGTAKNVIGLVLGFLQKEAPDSPVSDFLDQVPGSREAIDAAEASGGSGGGLGGLMGGMGGLMGLAGKLNAAGLDMSQIQTLGREIFAYAETILGKEKVQQIASSIPGLSQFV